MIIPEQESEIRESYNLSHPGDKQIDGWLWNILIQNPLFSIGSKIEQFRRGFILGKGWKE